MLLVSVRHSVCAPGRPLRPQALCGRPALPKIWTSALRLLERAEQSCTAVMEAIPSSWGLPLSEDTRGMEDKTEEEEWEKGRLALPPGLHHRMWMLGGGWMRGMVGGDVCGVHQEEIQLNYTRTECIFNHSASFPDSLCVRLWGSLGKRSCHLSLSFSLSLSLSLSLCPPFAAHTTAQQHSSATQYTAALAGADLMPWTDIL